MASKYDCSVYYEMSERSYEEVKSVCDPDASYLKCGFVGEDEEGVTLSQRYPDSILKYFDDFLRP